MEIALGVTNTHCEQHKRARDCAVSSIPALRCVSPNSFCALPLLCASSSGDFGGHSLPISHRPRRRRLCRCESWRVTIKPRTADIIDKWRAPSKQMSLGGHGRGTRGCSAAPNEFSRRCSRATRGRVGSTFHGVVAAFGTALRGRSLYGRARRRATQLERAAAGVAARTRELVR